jgi:hypothetical protein
MELKMQHPASCAAVVFVIALFPAIAAIAEAERQAASARDIRIMEPYIGEFRSPPQLFDDGKTEHHFLVKYQWFDSAETIVKVTISMVIPLQNRVIATAEGFYGFDSIDNRLFVFGAFTDGSRGFGSICEFRHATGARTVCVRSMNPDGSVTHVRDAFEVIDCNTWKNTTRIRTGEEGEWTLVHEGTYTRSEPGPACRDSNVSRDLRPDPVRFRLLSASWNHTPE